MNWIHGIPSVEAVERHERENTGEPTRHDGIRLGRIILTHDGGPAGGEYFKTDDEERYGNWICRHPKDGHFGAHVGMNRLRVAKGEVYMALGFCQWQLLSGCPWAHKSDWFPVGADGLPVGYTALREAHERLEYRNI